MAHLEPRPAVPRPAPRLPRRRSAGAWVLHPFLLAAYPVLFLFAQNSADQLSLDPVWLPLGVALAGAASILVLWTGVFRDVDRAGIATSVVVAAFFTFGHVRNLLEGSIASEQLLLATWIGLVVAGLVVAWRLGRRARDITAPLNLLAALALAFTMIGLGDFVVSRGAAAVLSPVSGLLDRGEDDRPDVYYLVFDRYAGSPALDRHFGFDNEPFLRQLEERDFFVARNSVANYVKTNLSLTSTLQMEYLDADALTAAAATPADQGPINRAFQGRLTVPASLKELGYRFVLVPSWWPPTARNTDADLTLQYEGPSEFVLALLDTTMVSAFTGPREEVDPFSSSELRKYTLHQIDRMLEVPASVTGPKFVMAHVLIPHPPNLFDRDGEPFRGDAARLSAAEKYVRQVEFTNSQILRMIDAIRAAPGGDDAAIIVQADEGPFPPRYAANGETFRWEEATAAELEIKFRILNAVRLPGTDPEAAGARDSMTPVNQFRIVFNALFDAGLPLLPDRVFAHADYRHFYDMLEVTDRIPDWSPD